MTRDLHRPLSRRELLRRSASGFGYLAFLSLLAQTGRAGAAPLNPLAPKLPHFTPRAKRVIFLFMHGGPSQVDTFDYKPLLNRDHGKPLPFPKPRIQFAEEGTGNLLGSPWKFKPHGQSGAWVSELFPELAQCVDDLCFIKSMHGTNDEHGAALLMLHTGSNPQVRPCFGSWITYGLGSENQNLPGFITICPTLLHGGVGNWSSAFLPSVYQGTPLGRAGTPAAQASIEHLQNRELPRPLQRSQLDFVQKLNRAHREQAGPDSDLDSRIESFELAFRMQSAAPEVLDISGESDATRKLYGIDSKVTEDFGRQCLLARRFAERGVRFVQVSHTYKWDQHSQLKGQHEANAREVDRPIAGLLRDLKSRGLLQDTLVLWAGEFGRTPVAQGKDGRDHNPHGYTVWMAGGGVRGGMSYGATDDYGYYAVENKVDLHDLHATILHLLGLDHERLTYHFAGRDFRLTDVSGRSISEIVG